MAELFILLLRLQYLFTTIPLAVTAQVVAAVRSGMEMKAVSSFDHQQ